MYKVRNENKRIAVKINNNLSLYEACRAIENKHGGIVLSQDGSGKLVSFWCSHYQVVCAGFGASHYERQQLTDLGYYVSKQGGLNV